MAKEKKVYLTPEGRLINHSLFELDQYIPRKGTPGTPAYKVELAFPKGTLDDLFNKCLDFAVEEWGKGADDNVIVPIKDGDEMAEKRAKAEKDGDAYAGMDVIRASTIFNRDGQKGPGGVQVLDLDKSEINFATRAEIYQGCMGIAAISMSGYVDEKTGNNAITFYLEAFKKTGAGERLAVQKDLSALFTPVGRSESTAEETKTVETGRGGARRKG